MPTLRFFSGLLEVATGLLVCAGAHATPTGPDAWRPAVDEAIAPIMAKYQVPGMAVAVTAHGRRHFFSYGVASLQGKEAVSQDTIFEIGSLSKTFTATLATYAMLRGKLSLSDTASQHLPALKGSNFDKISLLDLATYTAGGLPLQFPDDIRDERGMIAYYQQWQPQYAPGTHRQYSNPSIGLLGRLAADSLDERFDTLLEQEIFPALGFSHTYVHVPPDQMGRHAWGYAKDGKPVRVSPGVLDAEAYGVKTTAADMIRFIEENIATTSPHDNLRRAIAETHTGYYEVGAMTQGLGWEMYAYPVSLDRLLAGNSAPMALEAQPASKLVPPRVSSGEQWINKSGSTNGFGAYAAFVPARRMGIVMLANKNFPIAARVEAAYRILSALDGQPQPGSPAP